MRLLVLDLLVECQFFMLNRSIVSSVHVSDNGDIELFTQGSEEVKVIPKEMLDQLLGEIIMYKNSCSTAITANGSSGCGPTDWKPVKPD